MFYYVFSSLWIISTLLLLPFPRSFSRGYWKSFIDGIQRILLFTPDESIIMAIRAANSFSIPKFEASLSLKAIGLSLVDNRRKLELAYVSFSP